MKNQIASDLHLENWQRDLPHPVYQFKPDKSRDMLFIAGDMTDGNREWWMPFLWRELDISPVILVPGNHEYYYATKKDVDRFWRGYAEEHAGFHYLNNDRVSLGGLAFYGAEWCSDFWDDPQHYYFERDIADFWLTRDWSTTRHVEEFRRVTNNMAGLSGKADMVITHFPPTLEAIDQALYKDDPLNPYFINDCEWLVRRLQPKLWVSGHTHSPFDYQMGDTRVVINPCGYLQKTPMPGFSVMKTIEVE